MVTMVSSSVLLVSLIATAGSYTGVMEKVTVATLPVFGPSLAR